MFGKNSHLASYFQNMQKKVEKHFPWGEKILSSILDNVQQRNETMKIHKIEKYVHEAIILQNLLVNYTD